MHSQTDKNAPQPVSCRQPGQERIKSGWTVYHAPLHCDVHRRAAIQESQMRRGPNCLGAPGREGGLAEIGLECVRK